MQRRESDEREEERGESRTSEAEEPSAPWASTTPEISASEGSNLGQIEDSISAMRAEYVER